MKSKLAVSVVAVFLISATIAIPEPDGMFPGSGGAPGDVTNSYPSCSACHGVNTSEGFPTTSIDVDKQILSMGETINATISATGGRTGSRGGFIADVNMGDFISGSGSKTNNSTDAITHSNRNNRTWHFGYTAPNQPGLVEINAVVMTANGNGGTSGDVFSFQGTDPEDQTGTPERLFVLPANVEMAGEGCPDGFGNMAVLGTVENPNIGNNSFGFEIHGASTDQLVTFFIGPECPVPLDLSSFGLPDCFQYITSLDNAASLLSSSGSAMRGEGSAALGCPIPNFPTLQGMEVVCQAAYIDPSAPRPLQMSVTNAIRLTIQ